MRKLSCFFLAFVLFFNISFFSYATSDVVIGSGDVVFSYVPAVLFNNSYSGYYAYASSYTRQGSVFIIPRNDIVDNTIYIYNPDSNPYYYYVRGSSSSSIFSSMVRGTGSQKKNNSFSSPSTLFTYKNDVMRDSLQAVDVSAWDSYDYYYVSINPGSTMDTGATNFKIFSRASVSTPSPTPKPVVTPSPTPGIVPTSAPTSAPSGSDTLEGNIFWATCYNQTWENGGSSTEPFVQRFTPSSVSSLSDFSKRDITNYVYTYPIRIPFRITSNFFGTGLLDVYFRFAPTFYFQGFDKDSDNNITTLCNYSTPWIETSSGCSFNALYDPEYGSAFDLFNLPIENAATEEFYYCFNLYYCAYAPFVFTGYGGYVDVTMSPILFNVTSSTRVSDSVAGQVLDQINDNIVKGNEQDKQFHDEEMQEANKAIQQMQDGVGELTGVLSKWEIVTMPVTFVTDFAGAIASEGSTGLTFPSFTLMGYQLWPSYTFDLQVIKEKFPVLYNSLHIITGIMVVGWFLHYLWRKWHLLTGDDTPEV